MADARRPRILAVDDEPDIRSLLTDALSVEGYDVRATGDPVQALRWLREDDRFDVAIVDFRLPAMDGIELHRRMVTTCPRVAGRCIFISGLGQSKENLDYFLTHGETYLSKPFRLRDLVTAVREAIGR